MYAYLWKTYILILILDLHITFQSQGVVGHMMSDSCCPANSLTLLSVFQLLRVHNNIK